MPVVLDPVLRSSSGRELLDAEGVAAMRESLLPLVDWVTPNLEELGVLTGREVRRREDMPAAALALQEMGWELNVLATGGHLNPPDDLLVPAEGEMFWLPGEQMVSRSTHGTGCAFSSALLSRLVWGDEARDAAAAAKRYVAEAIRTAEPMGKGIGPVNIFGRCGRLSGLFFSTAACRIGNGRIVPFVTSPIKPGGMRADRKVDGGFTVHVHSSLSWSKRPSRPVLVPSRKPRAYPSLSQGRAASRVGDLTIHRITSTHHGRTLLMLGHAAEYLANSRRYSTEKVDHAANVEAIHILMGSAGACSRSLRNGAR